MSKPFFSSFSTLRRSNVDSTTIYLFILFSTIKITQTLNYTKMWRGDLKKPQSLYEEAPSWIFIKFSAKWCTVLHLKKKNDQNSSIWRKLATFCANYHVLGFSSSFRRKVWDFAKSHQSSSIWLKLAILRTTMF